MAERLTDLRVRTATAPEGKRIILWDAVCPGLGLRLGGRRKTWVAFYRLGGRRVMQTLGEFGEPPAGVPLARAREACRAALAQLDRHEDPRAHVAEIVPEQARESLAAVIADFKRLHVAVKLKPGTAKGYASRLDRISRSLGHRPITMVTRRDVLDLTEGLLAEGKPAEAVYQHRILSVFFAWCASRGVLAESPMRGLKPPARIGDRDRVLADPELRTVWLAAAALPPPWGAYVQLLLLTGQRAGELARLRWTDLDGPLLSIPNPKRGTPHLLRLPRKALAILEGLPRFAGPYVFCSDGEGVAPICPGSYLKAEPDPGRVRSRTAEGRRGHRPGLLDRRIAELVAAGAAPVGPFRLHDLRRTLASRLAELGTAPHVIEALLDHRSGTIRGVARVYVRFNFLDAAAKALESYAKHIDRLVTGTPPAKRARRRTP